MGPLAHQLLLSAFRPGGSAPFRRPRVEASISETHLGHAPYLRGVSSQDAEIARFVYLRLIENARFQLLVVHTAYEERCMHACMHKPCGGGIRKSEEHPRIRAQKGSDGSPGVESQ